MIQRSATAVWNGGLKDGKGELSTERGVLKGTPYNFSGRFEEGTTGTNPEELIGAAHAGCFSMAFAGQLNQRNATPESIQTTARVALEKTEAGMTVTKVRLESVARVPGADETVVREAAEAAKKGCPISRLLGASAEITLDLKVA